MRRIGILVGMLGLLTLCVPTTASAAEVRCPDPQGGYDHQYYVDPALECVFGDGNLGGGNDEFLDLDEPFGSDWNLLGSSGGWNDEGFVPIPGLTITNVTDTSFDWEIDPAYFSGGVFALGLKDGAHPQWAVFLLDGLSGTAGMTGGEGWTGSLSHITLYGTGESVVPEPASLFLFGTGLAGLAGAVRRMRKRELKEVR